jgi:hypothetical protein
MGWSVMPYDIGESERRLRQMLLCVFCCDNRQILSKLFLYQLIKVVYP